MAQSSDHNYNSTPSVQFRQCNATASPPDGSYEGYDSVYAAYVAEYTARKAPGTHWQQPMFPSSLENFSTTGDSQHVDLPFDPARPFTYRPSQDSLVRGVSLFSPPHVEDANRRGGNGSTTAHDEQGGRHRANKHATARKSISPIGTDRTHTPSLPRSSGGAVANEGSPALEQVNHPAAPPSPKTASQAPTTTTITCPRCRLDFTVSGAVDGFQPPHQGIPRRPMAETLPELLLNSGSPNQDFVLEMLRRQRQQDEVISQLMSAVHRQGVMVEAMLRGDYPSGGSLFFPSKVSSQDPQSVSPTSSAQLSHNASHAGQQQRNTSSSLNATSGTAVSTIEADTSGAQPRTTSSSTPKSPQQSSGRGPSRGGDAASSFHQISPSTPHRQQQQPQTPYMNYSRPPSSEPQRSHQAQSVSMTPIHSTPTRLANSTPTGSANRGSLLLGGGLVKLSHEESGNTSSQRDPHPSLHHSHSSSTANHHQLIPQPRPLVGRQRVPIENSPHGSKHNTTNNASSQRPHSRASVATPVVAAVGSSRLHTDSLHNLSGYSNTSYYDAQNVSTGSSQPAYRPAASHPAKKGTTGPHHRSFANKPPHDTSVDSVGGVLEGYCSFESMEYMRSIGLL